MFVTEGNEGQNATGEQNNKRSRELLQFQWVTGAFDLYSVLVVLEETFGVFMTERRRENPFHS